MITLSTEVDYVTVIDALRVKDLYSAQSDDNLAALTDKILTYAQKMLRPVYIEDAIVGNRNSYTCEYVNAKKTQFMTHES